MYLAFIGSRQSEGNLTWNIINKISKIVKNENSTLDVRRSRERIARRSLWSSCISIELLVGQCKSVWDHTTRRPHTGVTVSWPVSTYQSYWTEHSCCSRGKPNRTACLAGRPRYACPAVCSRRRRPRRDCLACTSHGPGPRLELASPLCGRTNLLCLGRGCQEHC